MGLDAAQVGEHDVLALAWNVVLGEEKRGEKRRGGGWVRKGEEG
jgi:hypothetical protein